MVAIGKRERKVKRGADAGLALHPDSPAVDLYKRLGDRQTEPDSSVALQLPEPIPDPWQLVRRNSWPGVGDGAMHIAVHARHPYENRTRLRSELYGVANQVGDDLMHAIAVHQSE